MAVIGQITPGMKMHLADWLSREKITEKTGGHHIIYHVILICTKIGDFNHPL